MRISLTLLLVAFAVGCNQQIETAPILLPNTSVVALDENVAVGAAAGPASEEFNTEGLPTADFDVPGLHCISCSKNACKILLDVEGVEEVKADSKAKTVTVAFAGQDFDREAVATALNDIFGSGEDSSAPAEGTENEAADDAQTEQS